MLILKNKFFYTISGVYSSLLLHRLLSRKFLKQLASELNSAIIMCVVVDANWSGWFNTNKMQISHNIVNISISIWRRNCLLTQHNDWTSCKTEGSGFPSEKSQWPKTTRVYTSNDYWAKSSHARRPEIQTVGVLVGRLLKCTTEMN